MNKAISKVWTFASSSSPEIGYETLLYADGTTSCGCPGWTRRVTADGGRSCKHTRLVDMGRADNHCIGCHLYQHKQNHTSNRKAQVFELPKLGHRKFAL